MLQKRFFSMSKPVYITQQIISRKKGEAKNGRQYTIYGRSDESKKKGEAWENIVKTKNVLLETQETKLVFRTLETPSCETGSP